MLPGWLLWVLLLGVACLRAALVFAPSMHLWGFNVARFLPPLIAWPLWLAMVLPLLPGVDALAARALNSL